MNDDSNNDEKGKKKGGGTHEGEGSGWSHVTAGMRELGVTQETKQQELSANWLAGYLLIPLSVLFRESPKEAPMKVFGSSVFKALPSLRNRSHHE